MSRTAYDKSHVARYAIGDRVSYRGKVYDVVGTAKPLAFDVGSGLDRHVSYVPTYDLQECGKEWFDGECHSGVRQDALRAVLS